MTTAIPVARPQHRLFNTVITASEHLVAKRDGTTVAWDTGKVARAIALAFYDVAHGGAANVHRDEVGARFGLDVATFGREHLIAGRVEHMAELFYRAGRRPSIEQIQDLVEKAIAAEGEWEVARSYIVFRERQRQLRTAARPQCFQIGVEHFRRRHFGVDFVSAAVVVDQHEQRQLEIRAELEQISAEDGVPGREVR